MRPEGTAGASSSVMLSALALQLEASAASATAEAPRVLAGGAAAAGGGAITALNEESTAAAAAELRVDRPRVVRARAGGGGCDGRMAEEEGWSVVAW